MRNVRDTAPPAYLDTILDEGFAVEQVPAGRDPLPAMRALRPMAACFQYDYPDIAGLSDLQRAKQDAPSTPLLMVTQEHSESLAVWAFRTRVWDYFIQPVEDHQLRSVLRELSTLRRTTPRREGERKLISPPHSLPAEARVSAGQTSSHRALDYAISHIDRNLHNKISQRDVARACNLTAFQLSRLFKQQNGVTFQEYVLRRRITQAMHLLRHPDATVTDVCFAVGFRDLSYFTRTFHRFVGEPPSRYRVTHQTKTLAPHEETARQLPLLPANPERSYPELRVEAPARTQACPSWPHACPMRETARLELHAPKLS